jgi:hypothetical protein
MNIQRLLYEPRAPAEMALLRSNQTQHFLQNTITATRYEDKLRNWITSSPVTATHFLNRAGGL